MKYDDLDGAILALIDRAPVKLAAMLEDPTVQKHCRIIQQYERINNPSVKMPTLQRIARRRLQAMRKKGILRPTVYGWVKHAGH